MDFEHGRAVIDIGDEKPQEFPASAAMMRAGEPFRSLRFDLASRSLTFVLRDGETIAVEVGGPGMDLPPTGVPVVYLDQLHWVALSQARFAPEKLPGPQLAAAKQLIALAEQRLIILPLAGAHLTESADLTGRWRAHLGSTMLGLSRGWQMRSPIHVRGDEMTLALRGLDPVAEAVFTLDPDKLLIGSKPPTQRGEPLPPPFDLLWSRLTSISGIYSAVVDDKPVEMSEAKDAAERWAATFARVGKQLRDLNLPSHEFRIAAREALTSDLSVELAQAAVRAQSDPQAFPGWLEHEWPTALAAMPSVARLYEVLHTRLANADHRWDGNDLNDINFLCCAAGYADVLVGEKATIDHLRRAARRVPPGAILCRKLPEAVAALHELGVRAEDALAA
jgi:hypothetical protein